MVSFFETQCICDRNIMLTESNPNYVILNFSLLLLTF